MVVNQQIPERGRSKSLRSIGRIIKSWRANPGAFVGLLLLLLIISLAVLGPVVVRTDPNAQSLPSSLKPPGWTGPTGQTYLLGTDQLGRDVMTRLMYGARTSLMIGLAAVLISGALGTTLGIIAGYKRGWVDNVISAFIDTQLAIPFILLTVTALGLFGVSLINIVVVLGILGWMPYARTARAETLALRNREFVSASEAIGAGQLRVMFRHILPNVLSSAIVISTLVGSRAILSESALSFLGLGVEPPAVSWGAMLAAGREFIVTAWWLCTFPGLLIMLSVLSINLLGDWLRDLMDPRLKGS